MSLRAQGEILVPFHIKVEVSYREISIFSGLHVLELAFKRFVKFRILMIV